MQFENVMHFRLDHIDVAFCYRRHTFCGLCFFVGHARSPAKTAEPIKMPFGGTLMVPRNHLHALDGAPHGEYDWMAMWFYVKLLWPLVFYCGIPNDLLSIFLHQLGIKFLLINYCYVQMPTVIRSQKWVHPLVRKTSSQPCEVHCGSSCRELVNLAGRTLRMMDLLAAAGSRYRLVILSCRWLIHGGRNPQLAAVAAAFSDT